MKERPILFNGEMVRAILDGRKTQTRRILGNKKVWPSDIIQDTDWIDGKEVSLGFESDDHGWLNTELMCPYGQPGDRLWVRETHAIVPRTAYAQSTGVEQVASPFDSHDAAVFREGWERSKPGRWRPSIHMPRWASRITLEITAVRVERLQDISEEDAQAEGAGIPLTGHDDDFCRGVFMELWKSVYGAESWKLNPWVWVLEFKRLERTQQEQAA